MTYSHDFRDKVLKIRKEEKVSIRKLSKRFGIGPTTIMNWIIDPVAKKTRNKPATKIDMEALKKDVGERPDAYLMERAKTFKVSSRCIFYALKRLGIAYKKNTKSPEGENIRRHVQLSGLYLNRQ